MLGTFDVENLGDLLFPFVAHHELEKRLGHVELELFSYRSLDPPAWPCKVRPVSTLAPRLGEFDLVLVGGGHIVRGDADVAPDYLPTDAVTSHPYGLWLTPTILAAAAGVPVAWNAIGAIDTIDETAELLVAAGLSAVDYLAVRDLPSARFVRAHAPSTSPVVVPDTVFGIAALLDTAARVAAADALRGGGVEGPYVVIQPAALLEAHREAVSSIARAATAGGLTVVELPIGPCHHDVEGRLGIDAPTTSLVTWPDPLVAAAIIAGAEAVVASSLHAGVIATSNGVPLVRPRAETDSKHEPLDVLPGVSELLADDSDREVQVAFGRVAPSSQVAANVAMLAHHWDEIAARATGRGRRGVHPAVAELLESLPSLFEHGARAAAAALAEVRAEADAQARHDEDVLTLARAETGAQRARADGLQEIVERRSVRLALRLGDATGRLRRWSSRRPRPER